MLISKAIRTMTYVLLGALLSVLAACGATRWEDEEGPVSPRGQANRAPESAKIIVPRTPSSTRPTTVSSVLNDFYMDWRGTPYQFGGTTRRGIDCSAFVQQAMSQGFGIALPRTTTQQLNKGSPIQPEVSRPGDLVFFKTGDTLHHVGVIVGPAKFMHASTKNGVTISRLDDKYWSARVIGYRRIIQ